MFIERHEFFFTSFNTLVFIIYKSFSFFLIITMVNYCIGMGNFEFFTDAYDPGDDF